MPKTNRAPRQQTTSMQFNSAQDHSASRPSTPYNNNDTLCRCMNIRRAEAETLIKRSHKEIALNELVSRSGAGTLCSGCHPLLREMLGEEIWTDVAVTSVDSKSTDIKSYRFTPTQGEFSPAKAGQHILVQAHIRGKWEMRRYTLINSAEETRYREIAVKIKSDGVVSNWLHLTDHAKQSIRISKPMGDTTPELIGQSPLVCLVAGVGITPALSFMRSIDDNNTTRNFTLDYSVNNKRDLIYKDEIEKIANRKKNIKVNFRFTKDAGYIKKQHVQDIVSQHPESDFFICGPRNYARSLVNYLDESGVNPDRISRESFSSTEHNIKPSKLPYHLGLTLFALFFLQFAMNVKLPWLEQMQGNEPFKIYSGLFIVLYILSQFIMPYNNACKEPRLSVKHYHRHKFIGCLAPLVFFFHSTQLGTAYLLLLSTVYFSNFLVGIFNHERLKFARHRVAYYKVWLPVHITLSVLLIGLVGFHVYVVASY